MSYKKTEAECRYKNLMSGNGRKIKTLGESYESLRGIGIHEMVKKKLEYCFFGGDISDCIYSDKKGNWEKEREAEWCVEQVFSKFKTVVTGAVYENLKESDIGCENPGVGIEPFIPYPEEIIRKEARPAFGEPDCLFVTRGKAYILDYKSGALPVSPDCKDMKKYAVAVHRKYPEYDITDVEVTIIRTKGRTVLSKSLSYGVLNNFTNGEYGFEL